MGDKSPIQWTEATWNPLAAFDRETGERGWFCTKVSEGCTNCYAEKLNMRLGNGHLYRVGNLQKIEWRLVNIDQPIRWKRPRMIFVNSMTDLFHEDVSIFMIARVFAGMSLAPHHTFQVLTKRAVRMRTLMTYHEFKMLVDDNREDIAPGCGDFQWPLPNVWLGVSTEHQKAADERIPELLDTPAAIRFLSCEPLLGGIDLTHVAAQLPGGQKTCFRNVLEAREANRAHESLTAHFGEDYPYSRIDWVIVGGESGVGSRPMITQWAQNIVDQCTCAGVAVFVKQLGALPVVGEGDENGSTFTKLELRDRKGGKIEEWPEDLRVRQMPEVAAP